MRLLEKVIRIAQKLACEVVDLHPRPTGRRWAGSQPSCPQSTVKINENKTLNRGETVYFGTKLGLPDIRKLKTVE